MRKKWKVISFILILSFVLPVNIGDLSIDRQVYAQGFSQINNRGITFNTGVSSDQIRLVKDFFRARGDKNVPWGYAYDARTKELVRNFQRQKGITADGIAGSLTIAKMNQEIRDKGYNIGLRQPSVNMKGDLLIINKSSNTLYLMKNGRPYRTYPVATGKQASLTPDGKHTVIRKFKNPAWGGAGVSAPIKGGAPNNPLGKRWIGLSVGGGGKYGVHGNSNPSSIGKYASMGCVRMFNPDVEKLYDEVAMGTPVWIGSESRLEGYGVKFTEALSTSPVKPNKPNLGHIVQPDAQVKLDGEMVKLNQPILNNKGTTYYPFREILENIGAEVKWDQSTKTASGKLGDKLVEFTLNSNEYRVNGVKKNLPKGQKAFLNQDDRTYIPIRYAMEGLGFEVDWDQKTKTIIINSVLEEEILEKVEPQEPIEEKSKKIDKVEEEEKLEDKNLEPKLEPKDEEILDKEENNNL